MAESADLDGNATSRPRIVFDWLRLSDALVLVWIGLVFLALGVPPLLTETVILGDGWLTFSPALEASLRWQFGHLPHVDYHTPVGVAYWLNQGLAVEVIGLGPKSGLVANLMAAAVIVLAGLFLVRARLTALITAVFMTGVTSLMLSLRPVDATGGMIGDISVPERSGLAIVAVLLVTFFLEPRTERRPLGAAAESLLVAGLLVWLVYLDAYFAALVALSGAAAMAFPSASRGLILEAMTFAALACIGLGFLFGIGVPYLADINAAIAVAPVLRIGKLVGDIQANLIPLGIVVVALGAYVLLYRADRKQRTDTVAVTIVLIFASVLAMNRSETITLPLAFVILVVLAARAQLAANTERQSAENFISKLSKIPPAYIPASFGAIMLVAFAGGDDFLSLKKYVNAPRGTAATKLCDSPDKAACSLWLLSSGDVGPALLPNPVIGASDTPSAVDMFVASTPSVSDYATLCEDDAFCLRRSVHQELVGLLNLVMVEGDKPLLLGVANPLPYYYGIEPPRNVLSVLAPGRTVSLKRHPAAGSLFSDTSLLIVPNSEKNPDFQPELLRFYEGAIARTFELIAETDAWSVHRKSVIK